ncbi:MAG: hypothetical protein AAFY57_00430 [Cyanobacteria bacterium J06642_2]
MTATRTHDLTRAPQVRSPQSLVTQLRQRAIALGAVAILGGGGLLGVCAWQHRSARPATVEPQTDLAPSELAIAGGGLAWLVVLAMLSRELWTFPQRRIGQPLSQITQAARRLGTGEDLFPRTLPYADEWSQLGHCLEQVNASIASRSSAGSLSNPHHELDNTVPSEVHALQNMRRLQSTLTDLESGRIAEPGDEPLQLTSANLDLPQVLETVQQLEAALSQLDASARVATENAQQQANAVTGILSFMRESEQSARQSAAEVDRAQTALAELHEEIVRGETATTDLSVDIDHLQAAAERIVQRVKSLSEFVEVADRFVQDQSQIASLTQTLAMSASLLSARASAQRDPNQFLPLALEFGAVAEQVQRLARQTNQELGGLRRRSTQVREAVTGANAEVESLSALVEQLSGDAARAGEVLKQVNDSTAQANRAEAAVTHSQLAAIDSTAAATRIVKETSDLADLAVSQMHTTRARVAAIDAGVQHLLQALQSLPVSPVPSTVIPTSLAADAPEAISPSG